MTNDKNLKHHTYNLSHFDKKEFNSSALSNSWTNLNAIRGNYTQLSYWRDAFGFGHLEGVLTAGTVGSATPAITLSKELSPYNTIALATISNGAIGRVDITTNGSVQILAPSSNAYVSFDSLYWPMNIEGWNTPSYVNSWADFGSTWLGGAYAKDPLGQVHMIGLIKSGTAGTVTTLGADYRPDRDYEAVTISNSGLAFIKVTKAGEVSFPTYSTTWTSLSGHNWTTRKENWIDIELAVNWSNYDSSEPAQYRVDAHGMVHLRGKIVHASDYVSQSIVFTIPDTILPFGGQIFPTNCDPYMGILTANVAGNGLVKHQVTNAPTYVSLDGIAWRINQWR